MLDTPIFYVLFSLSEYVTGLKIEFHNRDYEKKQFLRLSEKLFFDIVVFYILIRLFSLKLQQF